MPIKINAFRNQFYYIMPTLKILKANAIIVYRCLNNVKVFFSAHTNFGVEHDTNFKFALSLTYCTS